MVYLKRARRVLVTEWRYTYGSARRDGYGRRSAAVLFARELVKGLAQIRHP